LCETFVSIVSQALRVKKLDWTQRAEGGSRAHGRALAKLT
jgi:hypothetical protein